MFSKNMIACALLAISSLSGMEVSHSSAVKNADADLITFKYGQKKIILPKKYVDVADSLRYLYEDAQASTIEIFKTVHADLRHIKKYLKYEHAIVTDTTKEKSAKKLLYEKLYKKAFLSKERLVDILNVTAYFGLSRVFKCGTKMLALRLNWPADDRYTPPMMLDVAQRVARKMNDLDPIKSLLLLQLQLKKQEGLLMPCIRTETDNILPIKLERLSFNDAPRSVQNYISPDGKIEAFLEGDGCDIHLRDRYTKTPIKVLYSPRLVYHPCFSSNGQKIASSLYGDTLLYLWDITTGFRKALLAKGPVISLCCSPTEPLFMSGLDDGTICIWDENTGDEIKCLGFSGGAAQVLCCSPNGKIIASGAPSGIIRLWDKDTGGLLKILQYAKGFDWTSRIYFSSNGKFIISLSGFPLRTLCLWDVKTGSKKMEIVGAINDDYIGAPCLSSDGGVIAFSRTKNFVHNIDFINANTGERMGYLENSFQALYLLGFTPDGTKIIAETAHGDQYSWLVAGEGLSRKWDDSMTPEKITAMRHYYACIATGMPYNFEKYPILKDLIKAFPLE